MDLFRFIDSKDIREHLRQIGYSFTAAEAPAAANALYERVAELLCGYGLTVKTGVFGADMHIEQANDGPVTILLDFS